MSAYIITGASSGIGEFCARRLHGSGHTVVLVARNEEKMRAMAAQLGERVLIFPYDLDDTANIKTIFEYCKQNNLKLDGMIYSAGLNADVPMKVCSAEVFQRVLRVNCVAFAEMAKFFFNKRFTNDNARIVAISSSSSISNEVGMGIYSASKAALNSLVKTLAKELVRRGTLVNAVMPTGVLTPMAAKKIAVIHGVEIDVENRIRELDENPIQINISEAQPLGIITPTELAKTIEFLLLDNNRYITGALIPVGAGYVF